MRKMIYTIIIVRAVPIRDVSAVKDGRAELPCDIQPPDSNDKVPSPKMMMMMMMMLVMLVTITITLVIIIIMM